MNSVRLAQLLALSVGFIDIGRGRYSSSRREWDAPAVNTPIDLGGHKERRKKSTPSRAERKKG